MWWQLSFYTNLWILNKAQIWHLIVFKAFDSLMTEISIFDKLLIICTSRNDSVSNQIVRFDFGFWFQTEPNRLSRNQTIEISNRFDFFRIETDWNRQKSTYEDVEMHRK
jgi:hypothetical protein